MELIASRYEVLDTIRRNSRGAVFRGRDLERDDPVALKVRPCPTDASKGDLAGEVSVLLRVERHPGLPVVRDDLIAAEGDGDEIRQYVIVLDWIDGEDLDRVLAERPDHRMPLSSVVPIVSQAAEVLDHLHRQHPPVLHGDVKPSNLMLTREERVVLVDFDIASSGSFRAPAGSRGYTAPEVARGESVTPAIDTYGLAATAVKLLTGAPPGPRAVELLDGGDVDLAAAEHALRQALSTDPERRPGSAEAFADLLRESLRVPRE